MTLIKLEPCPSCGCTTQNAERTLNDRGCTYEWVVRCPNCGEEGQRFCAETPATEGDAVEAWNRISRVIRQRDAEIERLKKRISELEEPDTFWIADAPEEGSVNSASEAVNLYYGDCCCLQLPVEVGRASSFPTIWVVLSENGDDIIENIFHTKEEAEQFYQNMLGEAMHEGT